ncbi:MAG: aminotransferase class III-fold pyridoxal phosphate-dependent enzyme [Candidatus Promineifilaceae bacterium]
MTQHPSLPHVSPVWSRGNQVIAERGEGAYLYATDGTRYLDFTCGIGVTNTGHCHPHVVQAIQTQAGKLLHGQANIVYHPAMLSLIEELRQIVPPHIDGFFFSNSGAEAVEGSVKLARMATGRPNVIVFQGSFHGRTVGTMSLTTSKTIYRSGYQPLMAGVYVAPFPYAYRLGMSEEQASSYALEQLHYLLLSQTAPQETAAILIEPVLGEGGYVVPPASFLRGLRQICDEHGILLIFDEVQSGFGRTGKWFALEHSGVLPDIMTVAKGLASGMPLSGVFAPMALMQKWTPGSHGGTYGGNALACAAATATIQAIRHDNMLTNAQERGQQLMSGLRHLQEEYPSIGDVRGVGLMIATEFTASNGQPDKNTAKAVVKACFDQGLMLLTCGTYDNIVRWIPPLVVSSAQVNDAVGVFAAALQQVSEQ